MLRSSALHRLVPLAFVGSLAAQQPSATPPSQEVIQLDRFEVTSQKRVQAIQDVPIAVNAYSGDFLQRTGVTSYKDLAPFVPGLFIQEQSPNNPGLNVRGVTTDSGDPRQETRVSVFQDGVSISRSRGSVVELFDMERVEVLKGPQGTLFGRGAQIGAISLIQNKARNERSGELTVGAGNLGRREFAGHVNLPLVENEIFGRVAFTSVARDGSIRNVADGSDLNGKDTLAVRAALRWKRSQTTADLIVNYQNDDAPGTSFKSGTFAPRGGNTRPFESAELNRGKGLYIDRTVYGITGIVTHELSDALTLTSITGWREFDSFEAFDADGSRLFMLEFAEDYQGDQFSQEVRLDFDTGGRFTGFAGASYFDESGSARVPFYTDERQFAAFFLRANGVPVFNPDGSPFLGVSNNPITGAVLRPYNTEEYVQTGATRAWDAFADGTYRVTDDFELTAGLRLTSESITSGYRVINAATPAGFPIAAANFPNTLFPPTNGLIEAERDYTSWVARLVGRYRVSDQVNAFASVSRGRRPDTLLINFVGGRYVPVELAEEIVWNYEVGVKGALRGGRVTWNLSAFRYDYSNFQSTIVNPNPPPLTLTIDAGNATGQGFEAGVQGAVSDAVSVFATYGYTDATFDETDDAGRRQQFAGFSFRLTSRHTFSLGGTLTVDAGSLGMAYITPVWLYKSRHYFDDNNANFGGLLRQDAYSVVNLRAGLRLPGGDWEVAAFLDNALDEEYIIDAGNTGGAFGIPTFVAGDPRLYGVKLTRRF